MLLGLPRRDGAVVYRGSVVVPPPRSRRPRPGPKRPDERPCAPRRPWRPIASTRSQCPGRYRPAPAGSTQVANSARAVPARRPGDELGAVLGPGVVAPRDPDPARRRPTAACCPALRRGRRTAGGGTLIERDIARRARNPPPDQPGEQWGLAQVDLLGGSPRIWGSAVALPAVADPDPGLGSQESRSGCMRCIIWVAPFRPDRDRAFSKCPWYAAARPGSAGVPDAPNSRGAHA